MVSKDKQQGLTATFRTKEQILKRQKELDRILTHLNEKVKTNTSDMHQQFHQLKSNKRSSLNEPIDLQIEYDDSSNLVAVYRLKQAT